MKRTIKTLFLITLIASVNVLIANTFSLTVHSNGAAFNPDQDTIYRWGGAQQFDIVAEMDMKNDSSITITYRWTKLKSSLGSWEVAICDKNNCYLSSVTEKEFTLDAGKSGILNAHFYPDGVIGDGFLDLKIVNTDDTTDAATITYNATAYPTGIGDSKLVSYNFEIYPSPASEYINISFDDNELSIVEIYNILGKKLSTIKINKKATYSITDLPKGLYFIKVKDSRGVVHTKSFVRN
ncbi:MAG: T9SS type A sorting domain-containing protein [Bacteroidia bacterium]|nr:T9SS type A sorting domain-containing protein [Bacteroidia bacterium]